jgi:hypothetical protein
MTHDELARFAIARELIIIALAEHSLQALTLALLVEHPTLADHAQPATTPTLRRARAVVIAADRLRTTLAGYRAVVDAATRVSDPGDAAGF